MDMFATMRKAVAGTLKCIDAQEEKYKALDSERKHLEALPQNEASPYWHEGKYLYLIHPARDGYRARKYIGKDPVKVADALASIERFKKHKAIVEEMKGLKNRMLDAQFLIQQFESKVNGRGF